MGIIEVDMFSEDVNGLDHPQVMKFYELLKEVAHDYNCHLLSFQIDHGTVSFSFDDDELTAKILKTIQVPHSFVLP
jgi:ABC-type Mn2+/Zn2+ transport system ATPase subunit